MIKELMPVVGLLFGTMTLWINLVIDPSWASGTRKKILIILFSLYTAFNLYFLTLVGPDTFENLLTQRIFELVMFINWILLIARVYKLWPRQEQKES